MRPQYHYTSAKNWLSDPNGLVHDGTRWHLFYQYNPFGEDWGHMAWGHAVSPDLARWEELPPSLLADDREMVFSGSAVIDTEGTAGFGAGTMVAAYTSALRGTRQHQAQSLAYSSDLGDSWQRFVGNPVLDLDMADFRDPYIFRHEETSAWIMVVVKSDEQLAQIYRSKDLKGWTLASEISAGNVAGRVWECPTLVELPVRGQSRTRWLFKVDALHEAPGSGALAMAGDFDGHHFRADPDGWHPVDLGRDFYAAIAWNGPRDGQGRPVWIGWMGNHAYQHQLPLRGWRGVMSLPRRMELVETERGLRLAQEIDPAVAGLFSPLKPLPSGDCTIPVSGRIDLAPDFMGRLAVSTERACEFWIIGDAGRFLIARKDARLPFLDFETQIARREETGVQIWIDTETVEILTSDGLGAVSFQHRPEGSKLTIKTDCSGPVSAAQLL